MVLLLWLIKPLLYAVTFVLGARFFAASGTSPLSGRSLRLVVGLATVARLLLGCRAACWRVGCWRSAAEEASRC